METVKFSCCVLHTILFYIGHYASQNNFAVLFSVLLCTPPNFIVLHAAQKCPSLRYVFEGLVDIMDTMYFVDVILSLCQENHVQLIF
jgi:hypothetical protein